MVFLLLAFQFDAAAELAALRAEQSVPAVQVTATWEQPASAAGEELFVVSTTNCLPCIKLKAMLDRLNIKYTPLLDFESRRVLGFTPTLFPYMTMEVDGKRVGYQGLPSETALLSWLGKRKTVSAPQPVVCSLSAKTPEAVVNAILTHVASESGGEKPVGGLLDIEVPVGPDMRDLFQKIAYTNSLEMGRVKLSWKKISLDVENGRVTFKEPVRAAGSAMGVTIKADITAVELSKDGRTLDIEIDGFVDLRVVFTDA